MFISQPIPLVLASGSAIRQQMLKSVGLSFSVVPSGVDEVAVTQGMQGESIEVQALALARAKALAVAKDYPDHVTLGADQMCELDGEVLCKPGTHEAAQAQLRGMRGKAHVQHSAACLARGDEVLWEGVLQARLVMRDVSDAEIHAYVEADEPLQSCGSYKFEGMGRYLFTDVDGQQDVILGLPLLAVLNALREVGGVAIGANQ